MLVYAVPIIAEAKIACVEYNALIASLLAAQQEFAGIVDENRKLIAIDHTKSLAAVQQEVATIIEATHNNRHIAGVLQLQATRRTQTAARQVAEAAIHSDGNLADAAARSTMQLFKEGRHGSVPVVSP